MEYCQTYVKISERDPERAYLAVRGENTYLLESIEGSLKKARYSFIGFNPCAKLTIDKDINFEVFENEFKAVPEGEDTFEIIRSLVKSYSLSGPALSRFAGGFVGYIGYDVVRSYNPLGEIPDDLGQPDCEIVLTKNNIIFDHKTEDTYLVENHFKAPDEIDVEQSLRTLEEIGQEIAGFELPAMHEPVVGVDEFSTTKQDFEEGVVKAKQYIKDGDAFQIVLSQRVSRKYDGDKFNAYKRLMEINPSPYMYYLDFGDRVIVGSSPETLARVENNVVSTYPIAGTRKRGKDEEQDLFYEKELKDDVKENAEHLMLVDLGRNDVGRVSEYGSVDVTKFMEIERYSHVMHLSSEVQGILKHGLTEFDALKSIFPAGTVSGAPKVRAMQIIDEIEKKRRGIYAGAVGYFSFTGSMDTAIAIRTIVFEKDRAYVQAGAGIVADSKPELEYKETLNKATALLKALEVKG